MFIQSSFGGQTNPVELKQAILIYQGNNQAAATLNPVALDDKQRPQIGPGQPLTRADFDRLIQSLEPDHSNAKSRALMPENVLVAEVDFLLWWLPSQRRTIFFNTQNKQLNADLNGKAAVHPALLFKASPGGGLYVWAMAESKRPTPATVLYRAPYLNIYETGHLCEGSYRFPEVCRAGDLAKWEKGFFDTHFSHTNMDVRALSKHPHGHDALWREMVKTRLKYFPATYLAPMKSKDGKSKLKVSEVLNG